MKKVKEISYKIDNDEKIANTIFIHDINSVPSSLFSTPFVFAFKDDKVMLSLDKHGGWNPQGGHPESGEDLISTVKREAYEEAGIVINDIHFVSAIKFENKEYKIKPKRVYPPVTYLPIGFCNIVKIEDNWNKHETTDRRLVNFEEARDLLSKRIDNPFMVNVFNEILKRYKSNI
jgi:8-oxo-dGTP pyrophosphatase MutT (NUDIX family)